MSETNKLSKGKKFLSIISGAFLGGFMWHIRGSGGFGSIWGLLAFGTMMTLFIFLFYGNRANMKYELIPIGGLMAAFAVYSNGSVISMPGGILISDAVFTGEETQRLTPMSQARGALIMCLAGFALICLLGIFFGTLFSKKEYKLWHYLIYVATFFGFALGSKATVSQIIIKKLLPQVVTGFEEGLADRGLEYASAKAAYLANFNDIHFANDVPYGYPYYETIEHISFFIAAIALILVALIVFRDKFTALFSLLVNLVGAVAFTVPDYFQIVNFETSFLSKLDIPWFLHKTSWGMWEYGIGFILGLGIAIIIALLPNEYTSGKKFRSESMIENKGIRFAYNFVMFTLAFAVGPGRALGCRIADTLLYMGVVEDDDPYETIGIIVFSVLAGLFFLFKTKKNIIDKNLPVPFKMKTSEFAGVSLLIYGNYYFILKAVTGDDESIYNLIMVMRAGMVTAKEIIFDQQFFLPIIMFISLIIFECIFEAVFRKQTGRRPFGKEKK